MCIAPSWRKWEEMRYPTFLGRRHKSRWTHSPQTRLWNKMAVFWSYFRDFVVAQKIEDLTESKNIFTELFQIINRFVLAKKNFGVRCTLKVVKTMQIQKNELWSVSFTIEYKSYLCPSVVNQQICVQAAFQHWTALNWFTSMNLKLKTHCQLSKWF